jgi:hypothetical protein
MILYKIDVCINLIWLLLNSMSEVRQNGIDRGCSRGTFGNGKRVRSHNRLYKKKTMMITITLEINLVYSWSPPPCTQYKQVLMWSDLWLQGRSIADITPDLFEVPAHRLETDRGRWHQLSTGRGSWIQDIVGPLTVPVLISTIN